MKDRYYNAKSVLQMILREGYTDYDVIAEELGITRRSVVRIINQVISKEAYELVMKKLAESPKNNVQNVEN